MIDRIIRFSIEQKAIVGFFVLALIVWGGYSLTKLPIDAVPDITNNQVQIITLSPNLAAPEVEQFISARIEVAMASIPNVIEIRSISRMGLSVVTVVFQDAVAVNLKRQLVGEKLKEVEEQIPPGLGTPEIAPSSTGLGEIYQYVVHAQKGYEDRYSPMELRTIQDWIVKRQLLGTPGVAEINSMGGYLKQYEVAVDPDKLNSMDISLDDIFTALAENNENSGGAYIEKSSNLYFIRGLGLISSLEDIQKIAVKTVNGMPVLLGSIAEVGYGSAVRYGGATRNGEGEAVVGTVMMLKGENSAEVVKRVKTRLTQIEKTLPEGVAITPFLDRTKLIDKAIRTVTQNLIEGGLIVIFVLVLLLGNLRAGLLVASVIPLSMLFAFGLMNLFGVSGNLMSLGAIDFGLIVDGAVIIVEATLYHLHSRKNPSGFGNLTGLTQAEMDEAVYQSAVKIQRSATFGVLIILIVYLPILALTGIEGKMFKPMAQTVGFALLGSLLLSLTYVPMMSTLVLSKQTAHKKNISDWIMATLLKIYEPSLKAALRLKALVLVIALGLFGLAVFIFLNMGGEFIPTLEEGDLATHVMIKPGSSLIQMNETTTRVEKIIMENFPEVEQVVSKIGSAEIPTDPMPIEVADAMIILKDKSEWTSAKTREELVAKIEAKVGELPGVTYEFQQPIQMRFNELMTGVRSDIAIKIYGEDLEQLVQIGNQVVARIGDVAGVKDLKAERISGLPQIFVAYDRGKLAQHGLSIADVNQMLRTAFAGEVAGVVFEGEKRFDLVVRLHQKYRQDLENVRNLYIETPSGAQIPLKEIANIDYHLGAAQISRDDAKRRITVTCNVRNRDIESVIKDIQKRLDSDLKLPTGYYLTYGGQFENLKQAKDRLQIAVPVALALIFFLLLFTFDSVKEALLIFTAVPLATIGGVFALVLRDLPFSISAGVGFIALFGIAVLNGIVLISYFNQLEKEGVTDVIERILKGATTRLRPVLMTATAAALGFLPMAISGSAGAEVQRPLATVVIGGLITSTFLTLLVLPVLYSLFKPHSGIKHEDEADVKLALALALVGLLAVLPQSAQAQEVLTLDRAIDTALKNNAAVQAARLTVEQQKLLGKAAFDPPKTNFELEKEADADKLTISQAFAFPTVYAAQSNFARQHTRLSQYQLELAERDIVRATKTAFYQLDLGFRRLAILSEQDSLYARLARVAEIKYQSGGIALLEKLSLETRFHEVQNERLQAEADIALAKLQLQAVLQDPNTAAFLTACDVCLESPPRPELPPPPDSTVWRKQPQFALLQAQVDLAAAEKRLHKNALLPDFSLGYFRQKTGAESSNGFVAGLSLPLWFRPQTARIQAAERAARIAEKNAAGESYRLRTEMMTLAGQAAKLERSLAFYEQRALPEADALLRTANRSYELGETAYVAYLQSLTQAFQIRLTYLEQLNAWNQTIAGLSYFVKN